MDRKGLTCMENNHLRNVRAHVFRDGAQSVGIQQRIVRGGLRRRGAHTTRDAQPVCAIGKCLRQMQHDTAHGTFDPHAEIEQTFAQGADLSACTSTAAVYQTQLLHQHVGGGSQQYTQLVREEAGATGPVDFQSMMQLFYPVLHPGSSAIDPLIQPARPAGEVCNDKTRVVLRRPALLTHDLRLDDHATLTLPAPRCVTSFSIDMGSTTRTPGLAPCSDHQPSRPARQTHVFGHRHDVVATLSLQELKDLRRSKPTVQPNEYAGARERVSYFLEDAAQYPDGPACRGRITGPQYIGKQILLRFMVKGEKPSNRQVTPGVIVGVEERQLLRAVRRVIGWGQIDCNVANPAPEPPTVSFNHTLRQGLAHPVQIGSSH